MADNLIFPIGFDLESAVKEAGKEWDSAYAAKLEKLLAKRPVKVELDFDTKKLNNLDDVKRRLAELKIEPITPENKTAIRDLVRELKELARIMEKVQKFKGIELPELQAAKAAKLRKDVAQADEKLRLSQERVRQAQERLTLAQQRAEQQARRTSNAYASQGTYLQKLTQRMAAYWSVHQVGNFLTAVRDVTAEFELQRISLGAIIQDQARANQLFAEIKSFALKSPVKILDLTKYTKQLAAYKIGVDELFETTKKLTDVSVGLGVSMDRVVLAYGQVRARGALYSSEIRQFTEMGVPIVEELATKLTKMNGELVTSAQVLDLVQKGAISFEMVKEVFDDMTSAGGIFYNMQEKQGNTLYGMWAKLGDAASVMYDKIGNTGAVSEGMRTGIELLTKLMRNYEQVLYGAATAAVIFVAKSAIKKGASAKEVQQNKTVIAAVNQRKKAELELKIALDNVRIAKERNIQADIESAKSQATAARETLNKAREAESKALQQQGRVGGWFSTMAKNLGAGLLNIGKSLLQGGLWAAAIVGITSLISALTGATNKAKKLKGELESISLDIQLQTEERIETFEHLVKVAVSEADGTKKQKEALDELSRTYGAILPAESLRIENLRAMNGEYGTLINMIKQAAAAEEMQRQLSAVEDIYGPDNVDRQKKLLKNLTSGKFVLANTSLQMGIDEMRLSKREGSILMSTMAKVASEEGARLAEEYSDDTERVKALIRLGVERLHAEGELTRFSAEYLEGAIFQIDKTALEGLGTMGDYLRDAMEMASQKSIIKEDYEKEANELDQYSKAMEGFGSVVSAAKEDTASLVAQLDELENSERKVIDIIPGIISGIKLPKLFSDEDRAEVEEWLGVLKDMDGTDIEKSFVAQEAAMQDGISRMKKMFKQAGIEFKDEWLENMSLEEVKQGLLSWVDWKAVIDSIPANDPQLLAQIKTLKSNLESLQPSDEFAKGIQAKWRKIASSYTLSLAQINNGLWDGKGTMEDYRKHLENQIKATKQTLKQAKAATAEVAKGTLWAKAIWGITIGAEENNLKALEEMLEDIKKMTIDDGKGGSKSDPRLGILQEMVSTLKQVNKEYDDLAKKEGATKALEDTANKYENTFKYLQSLATKYKFELPDFGVPTDAASLTRYLNAIKDAMKKLPESEKAVLSLETDISDINMADAQKKIEEELKRLADRISRTKTAKEFYDKILGMTGDMELAADVSMSVYGGTGEGLQAQLAKEIRTMFAGFDIEVPVEIVSADNRIDYRALEKYVLSKQDILGGIESQTYKELMKIAKDGQRDLAKTYEGYLKDLEKAKTYSDKRIELARYTANKIAEINASTLPQEEKDRLTAGYRERERQKHGEIEWEAFKDMPMYVQMFDDLDNASATMLTNMKSKLLELQSVWGSTLNPTQLKELQSRLSDIDAQLAKKNPFKTLSDAMKQYRVLSKGGTQADAERGLIEATKKHQDAQQKLNMALENSLDAQEKYNEAVSKYGADSEQAKGAKMFWDAARQGVDDVKELVKQTGLSEKEAQRVVNAWKKVKDSIGISLGGVFQIAHSLSDLASGIGKITEVFGGSEEDVQYWNDISDGLNEVTSGIENMVQAAISGNPIGIVTSAITSIPNMISGFSTLFSAGKIRKANKEIKRQQELLEQLQYAYSRLENASDKVFGRDYINNFRQQQKNLEAQARAYQKQAAAERSKGKKADKDKIKEYENAYRDTMDEIADMQGQIAAQMLGTDLTSAARDFAKAWLDAYKEFGNTADAMSEKFHEMIENMIMESLLAKVMERALKPAFDMIDNMGEEDFYSQSFWEQIMAKAEQGAKDADHGAQVMMEFLEKAGISMRDMNTEYTGMKRDIAGASEETMSSVAVIGNTLMYYVSPIPRMDENLAAIRRVVEAGTTPVQSTAIDTTALWNRHLELQQGIYEHTRRSAEKCEAMAAQCAQMASDIHKVIVPRGGGSAAASIQVRM
ncbi:MAG: hypothetical protein BHV69_10125 [Bacteroidales bacterium 52_46]|nr:MAG: hypothetical protein BHV69_10125 [Bacteroidales bacterium 52_46]